MGLLIRVFPHIISVTGLAVMIAWGVYYEPLIFAGTENLSMKPFAALLFFLSGLELCLLRKIDNTETSKRKKLKLFSRLIIAGAFVIIAISIGVNFSTEAAYLFNLAVSPVTSDNFVEVPLVPSVVTIGCFLFIFLLPVIFSTLFKSGSKYAFYIVGLLNIIAGSMAILGFIFNEGSLYFESQWGGGMAPHTASLLILVGIYLISLRKIKLYTKSE